MTPVPQCKPLARVSLTHLFGQGFLLDRVTVCEHSIYCVVCCCVYYVSTMCVSCSGDCYTQLKDNGTPKGVGVCCCRTPYVQALFYELALIYTDAHMILYCIGVLFAVTVLCTLHHIEQTRHHMCFGCQQLSCAILLCQSGSWWLPVVVPDLVCAYACMALW